MHHGDHSMPPKKGLLTTANLLKNAYRPVLTLLFLTLWISPLSLKPVYAKDISCKKRVNFEKKIILKTMKRQLRKRKVKRALAQEENFNIKNKLIYDYEFIKRKECHRKKRRMILRNFKCYVRDDYYSCRIRLHHCPRRQRVPDRRGYYYGQIYKIETKRVCQYNASSSTAKQAQTQPQKPNKTKVQSQTYTPLYTPSQNKAKAKAKTKVQTQSYTPIHIPNQSHSAANNKRYKAYCPKKITCPQNIKVKHGLLLREQLKGCRCDGIDCYQLFQSAKWYVNTNESNFEYKDSKGKPYRGVPLTLINRCGYVPKRSYCAHCRVNKQSADPCFGTWNGKWENIDFTDEEGNSVCE